MLTKRIALIEGIQELVHARDLGKIEKKERLRLFQLVSSNDIEPSEALKLNAVCVAAQEQARLMVTTKTQADLELFLAIVVPFNQEMSDGFDFFSPSMNSVVLEAVSLTEEPDDCSGWGALVKLEEGAPKSGSDQHHPAGDWEACDVACFALMFM